MISDTTNANLTSNISSLNGDTTHRQNGSTHASFHNEETSTACSNTEQYRSVIQESFTTSDHIVQESSSSSFHEQVSHDQFETSAVSNSELIMDGCEITMQTKEVVTTVEKITVTKQQTESFSSEVKTIEAGTIVSENNSSNEIEHSLITTPPQADEVSPQSEKSDSFVNKEIPSPEDEMEAPFDNITVTDVDNENLTAKERFLSTVTDLDEDVASKLATVKDRMFLSTDSACLLFTQTVVQSPMLTPTDENYDFLQGLRQSSSDTNITTPDDASPVKIEPVIPQETTIEQVCLNGNTETLNSGTEEVKKEVIEQELSTQIENQETLKDADDEKLDFSEISAENEVCNQLESSNSEADVSEHFSQTEEPHIVEQIPKPPVSIKDVTLEFLQCEISEIDGDLQLKNTTVSAEAQLIKQAPEIVEELIKEAEELVENREELVEIIETEQDNCEQDSEICENSLEQTDKPVIVAENLLNQGADTQMDEIEESEAEIKSSPSKVSEISKIFTAEDKEAKEVVKTPSPLPETFENIQKTKEMFEQKSKSPDCNQNSDTVTFRSSEMDDNDDDEQMSEESDAADCDTNIMCPVVSVTFCFIYY